MSAVLRAFFLRAIEQLEPNAALLELESSLTEFLAAMLKELAHEAVVAPMTGPQTLARSERDAAEHARARLTEDTRGLLGLTLLASETGLSRFRLLSAFKRCYGIPPQSYRMRVRMALAQRMLRDGSAPATVAFELGFSDQSQFTHHFERVVGVTPAACARNGLGLAENDIGGRAGASKAVAAAPTGATFLSERTAWCTTNATICGAIG